MAQIVEPDAPQSGLTHNAIEIFIERARLKRCSDPCCKDESAFLPSRASRKPFFELAAVMIPKRGHKAVMKRERTARLAALGLDELKLAANPCKSLSNRYSFCIEINIGPSQPQRFPTSETEAQGNEISHFQTFTLDGLKKRAGFARLPMASLPAASSEEHLPASPRCGRQARL